MVVCRVSTGAVVCSWYVNGHFFPPAYRETSLWGCVCIYTPQLTPPTPMGGGRLCGQPNPTVEADLPIVGVCDYCEY